MRKIPRVEGSLPGKYPGKVVRVKTGANLVGQKIDGARGIKQVEGCAASAFLDLAEGLGLGVAAREKIEIADVKLGRSD